MHEELVKRLRRMLDWELCDYDDNFKFADETIAEAADAIEKLSKPLWIPVTERLPPYGDRILITDKTGVWEGCLSYSRGFMRNTGMTIKDIYDVEVTHWMPLPEPPKEET